VDLCQSIADLVARDVLQDAVGRRLAERAVGEGQVTAVGDYVVCTDAELRRHAASGADAFYRWIDTDGSIALAGGGDAPSSPTTTVLRNSLPSAAGRRRCGIGYSFMFRTRCWYSDQLVAPIEVCANGSIVPGGTLN
jgi:hypothetical protein